MLQKPSRHRVSLRPALLDAIAEAGSDEAALVAELRAIVAEAETPADRMLARYRGWPSQPAIIYGRYRD